MEILNFMKTIIAEGCQSASLFLFHQQILTQKAGLRLGGHGSGIPPGCAAVGGKSGGVTR
jgi:hypothetical protein